MFTICLLACLVVILTYYGSRAYVVTRLRAEYPQVLVETDGRQIGGAWFMGISLWDPLLELLDRPSVQIDPSSPIWLYVKIMKACVVLLVLVGVAAVFALAA